MGLLEELQRSVDELWQKVIYAKDDSSRSEYRTKYLEALDKLKKQQAYLELLPKSPPAVLDPIKIFEEPSKISAEDAKKAFEVLNKSSEGKRSPSPMEFHDYLDFFISWVHFNKTNEKGTLTFLSKKTGIAPNKFVKFIKRQYQLKSEEHLRLIEILSLNSAEAAFLEALYILSYSDSNDEKQKAMEQILAVPSFRKNNPQEYETWKYLSHWYYVAIYELSTLPGFRIDPTWIQKRLIGFVPLPNIKKALIFLEGAQFIKLEESGKVVSLRRNIKCLGGVYRLALRQFHIEMLEQAAGAITRVSSEHRRLLSHTMAVPNDKKEQLFAILSEAIDKIQALGQGEKKEDQVYHIELAAFPLTKDSLGQ